MCLVETWVGAGMADGQKPGTGSARKPPAVGGNTSGVDPTMSVEGADLDNLTRLGQRQLLLPSRMSFPSIVGGVRDLTKQVQ